MKRNENLTELVFILDRSGSMNGLEADTIGGYNSLLEKQRQEPGEALITTALFDDRYEMLHRRVPIRRTTPLTSREYFVRGTTALHDAIGRTIQSIQVAQNQDDPAARPARTMLVIITDGLENASREWKGEQIRTLVEACRASGWEFVFLGANMDAIAAARAVGIQADRAVSYHADSEGTALNYDVLSKTVSNLRAHGQIESKWKETIDKDFKTRKRK